MGKIVAKFGGSSLSDAGQFRKVKKILEMDERRCYVVPSAPGRRFPEDEKVTDLLYRTYRLQSRGEDFHPAFSLRQPRRVPQRSAAGGLFGLCVSGSQGFDLFCRGWHL